MKKTAMKGFTLIEVLIALSIIAIALLALIRINGQQIAETQHLQDAVIREWVSNQAITMIQLKLLSVEKSQEITEVTTMFGERWYWRPHMTITPIKNVERIEITSSKKHAGPFTHPVIGFRYAPSPDKR